MQRYSGFGTVGEEIKQAIRDDFDAKIIITSHNSKPGLGKTTLAIQMAHAWDPHGWTAEEKAFMNAHEFHNAYMNEPKGSVLLFDEIENEADSRRAMSGKNVNLTQMLATQRFRNIVSIYTLPTVSMLDNRMMEMADYWINVMRRGAAHPYKIYVNDFTGNVSRKWIGQPESGADGETIHWEEPERGTQPYRDKQYLDQMKKDHAHIEREHVPASEVEKRVEKAREKAQRERRDEIIQSIMANDYMSAGDLAEVSGVDVSRPRVHQIANGD
jgi:hypothetical protein